MSKETETTKNDALVAQFRFAMIAPVIQGFFLTSLQRLTISV
jgi:hypothetical protein